MKQLILTICLLAANLLVKAQTDFVSKGKITFEKKVNMVRKVEEWNASDDYKDKIKRYQSTFWEYDFNDHKSLFKAAKKDERPSGSSYTMFFGSSGPNTAQLYSDFDNNTRILKKSVSGVDYLLKDTIPKLEWKIQQEIREIAGYECRKAIARYNDTIYAVAYYTDKILPKGGPEGFTGLPGMILGLAIPRLFTTWFATAVVLAPENQLDLAVPSKGDTADNEKDYKKLVDLLTRYDQYEFGNVKQTPEQIRKRLYSMVL